MDDRIRVSDADREQVIARLREHYAEGRLSSDELDERISAALSARTFGDLRPIMADLPGPGAAPGRAQGMQGTPPWALRNRIVVLRRPRILPLILIVLIAAVLIPGIGFVLGTLLKLLLITWLVACLAGVIAVARFRHRMRRQWQSGHGQQWRQWQQLGQRQHWQQWHQWQQHRHYHGDAD
jgi:Domain of unknown function (DUF1707)